MLPGSILVLLTLTGSALFFFPPVWFPFPISAEALEFDREFAWTLGVTAFLFIGAQMLLAWTVWRARRGERSALYSRGAQRLIEPASTVLLAALFLTLSLTGSRGWAKITTAQGDAAAGIETIEVYAHQFAWNFRYPGADQRFGVTATRFINDAGGNPLGLDPADQAGRDDVVTASLHIPVHRDVLLLLHSRDVIHDFFVRELRTKQDIVPGMEIPLRIRVDMPGRYEIACAELCGLGHSQMKSVLIAMPPAEYNRWKQSYVSAP